MVLYNISCYNYKQGSKRIRIGATILYHVEHKLRKKLSKLVRNSIKQIRHREVYKQVFDESMADFYWNETKTTKILKFNPLWRLLTNPIIDYCNVKLSYIIIRARNKSSSKMKSFKRVRCSQLVFPQVISC